MWVAKPATSLTPYSNLFFSNVAAQVRLFLSVFPSLKTRTTTRTRFSQYYLLRAQTSVILAGKHDSCRHSTTSFSETLRFKDEDEYEILLKVFSLLL